MWIKLALASAALAGWEVSACAEPLTLQDAIGSDDFKISGSARVRYESFDNNFRPTGPEAADLMLLRTRIEASYDAGPVILGGELRDSRGYFGETDTPYGTAEVNPLELIQLYAQLDLGSPFAPGGSASITGGRFLLDLGSSRLVGDPSFRNAGNAFTGVRADWRAKSGAEVTLFYTYPQQRLPSTKARILDNAVVWDHESDDLRFWGAFAAAPLGSGAVKGEAYLYGLDETDRPDRATRNRHLKTVGTRIFAEKRTGKVDFELEYAWQSGDIRTSTGAAAPRVDVSAHTAHVELGYGVGGAAGVRMALIGDWATGDDPGSASFNGFDALFGPRRSDWGPTSLYGPLGRSNIRSVSARFEAKPSKRLDGYLQLRAVWLDEPTQSFAVTGVRDPSGQSGTYAGKQLDFRVRWWVLPKQIRIDTGGALLAKGRFLRDAPNAPSSGDTRYGYLDVEFYF